MPSTTYCEKATTRAQHGECSGYLHPLLYSEKELCECECHEIWNIRDYQRAIDDAVGRTYGAQ